MKATLKNNKATIKLIELNEKGTTTTIKIQLIGKSIGKDKLTVYLTTDSGRKVTRRCNISVIAPKKETPKQEPKKETPKKQEPKKETPKKDKPKKDNKGIEGNEETQAAADDFLDWLHENPDALDFGVSDEED